MRVGANSSVRITAEEYLALQKPQQRGRGRHTPGEMNGTEAEYASELEIRKASGEIAWYAFEAITFKIAKDCRYTPDFIVMMPDGYIEAHEVKGHWEDDALVKVRVAASKFPFKFVALQKLPKKQGGGFSLREF